MLYKKTICFLLISFTLIIFNSSNGQTLLRDDFKFKSNTWYWRADGNQSVPTVENGLLHLKLENAVETEYCNTEIYDSNATPYSAGTNLRIRLKGSPQHIGSRGWGFWDGSLTSVQTDYDVAWVMQQKGISTAPEYNWFLFGVDGDAVIDRSTIELSSVVDDTTWNTYHINWRSDSTFLYINDSEIFVATNSLPDENMRVDLWIDNRVINITNPLEFWNNNSSGSEMFVDFIEVFGINGPSIERNSSGSIILWESPNTYPNGDNQILWKNYNFTTHADGEALIFITGDAESYNSSENDDDMRIAFDDINYGWDNINSFDGNQLNGDGTSVSIKVDQIKGDHNLKIYSDNTPFLRDVLVLFYENGEVVLDKSYNEIADGTDSLYKSLSFNSLRNNNTVFLLSGTGFEGDKIRIEIDDIDYSYSGENSIDGNELMGTPKTIVISKNLNVGSHTIKVFKTGSPHIYNIASYSVPFAEISIKAFLEGSYIVSNEMYSDIAQSNDFPKLQPFNKLPWNYSGVEKIDTIPENIIDWVLIEIRNEMSNPTKKYFQAALLRNNGSVVNTEGENIIFLGIESGNYYLIVSHRNHLPILSSETIFIP